VISWEVVAITELLGRYQQIRKVDQIFWRRRE
jgi:hypothetical protein